MATKQNLDFDLGEDWIISLDCADNAGAPIDLTGGDVKFRLAKADGSALVLDLSTANAVAITNAAAGIAVVTIDAARQAGVPLAAGLYAYEAQAVLAVGTITDQARGTLYARASLFVAFP